MRLLAVRGAAAAIVFALIVFLAACGGSTKTNNNVTQVVVTPGSLSLNEGAVGSLSAVAENSAGTPVAADISFTSSNPAIATVSTGGLVCAGVWDANFINCTPTIGQGGVGQVTITATATAFNVSSTATIYVHLQVDQVVTLLNGDCPNGQPAACNSMGQQITICGKAFSTTAPGCSPSAPCDITDTVGPFAFGSNNGTVASSSAGLVTTFDSQTNTPVYLSGGTITGSSGQTCSLSNFNTVAGAMATVTLTGTNTIASGTHLDITAPGHGATSAPTTAQLSNGTATCSGTANVQTSITNGAFTAQQPGTTTVFASVSGVNSVGVPYTTCAVQSIVVHDVNSSNTSFTLDPRGTQSLVADVMDSAGVSITPTLNWSTSLPSVATVAPTSNNQATVTGVAGGTAYVTAACSNPDCNIALPAQYGQNVDTFAITQPAATIVYAASTSSTMLVPINSSNNTTGTAITLPGTPNSIIADPAGAAVYLGTSAGVVGVAAGTGTISNQPTVTGTIVGISHDGRFLLLSDSGANTIRYFTVSNGSSTTTSGTTNSTAYTPESKSNDWVSGTTLGFGSGDHFVGTVNLPQPANAIDISAQGGLTYITSAMAGGILQYATCNLTLAQTLSATAPTLIKALPNGTGAVATDPPNIDVVTSPAMLMAGCQTMDQSGVAQFDMGVGSFTAQQLFVSPDAKHAYIVAANLPMVLSFDLTTNTAASAALVSAAQPFSGGITPDSSSVYVGGSDNLVHQIDTATMTDKAQVAVNLKDANNNVVVPNLVTVLP